MDQKFIQTQIKLRGEEKALNWIKSIPNLICEYEKKWNFRFVKEFPELSYNFVGSVKTKNGEAVLKIGFPDDKQFITEAKTLKIYNGDGSIKLLNENFQDFVLLLEKCIPGDPLYSLNNEENETLIFTQICKKIWKKPPSSSKFPNLAEDLKDFDWYFQNDEKIENSIPKELVEKAKQTYERLLKSQKELYLLHTDLHHDNILLSERGWLAIDCKGAIGEREYESTAFIRNPIKKAEQNLLTGDILKKRIDIIVEKLGLDRQRIIDWAFAQTVLSVIWSLQDTGSRVDYWLRIAQEIEEIK